MKHNIIWIILDGVRNYPCPDDPQRMGRPELFDKIAKEGVYFEQSVASATSTYMSISSMMLGIPSYYLSRNLEDFKLDKSHYESLAGILGNHEYTSYSISVSYEIRREGWRHILPPISEKYWPKGEKRMLHWNNDPINPTIFNQLEAGVEEPFFLFVHYNARRDSSVSLRAEKLLNELKSRNLYDNSILVLCSDHGMPDTARSDYAKWLRDRGLYFNRHDLIMTDDNIMTPLFIKYPDGPKGIKIKPCVGNIDISPTLLDIVGIKSGPDV
ncbi:MAG: sulfatase-like hydrolase/transferase, partial [Candidatus Marinimicrobia bacterium]|nr:sulfatase-like hydrolase/transferase [Candidatus Neomarinimicrobiota bacterium]